MKIRKLTPEYCPKAAALLLQAFPRSKYEVQLFEKLHEKGRALHEWVCIHRDTVTAYIAFSNAYNGTTVCGLHLAPLAVRPQMQGQGIGSELLRFALRQDVIKESTLFVLGSPKLYLKFGFERCAMPLCPFDTDNTHFLSIRNTISRPFTVGYEPEFKGNVKQTKQPPA
jgi:putative acetyltransferase